MAADLAVTNGGTMINAEGIKGEKETFGKGSPWIDFFGKRGNAIEGLAIMPASIKSLVPLAMVYT